ncbi:uncharacterized protein CLIB1444_04S10616 [[Candida] jaroonii]|uniref:Uncharacterized protein n=1 Tax=[Candida] jaroonii TaxID=467808 RepID=A0ACA9Y862_9ASCO|nr:uncharacterized protein CLIB1444_04S10616 [[Candida] jaroonii]
MLWLKNLLQLPFLLPLEDTGIDHSSIRDLNWGDINFLHTTDTHGWLSGHFNQKQYDANWGDFISFTSQMKSKAHSQGQDLIVVDTGDRHDGNGLSDATVPNGNKSLPIFAKQDYDILTIGNHELYEWENSKTEYEFIASHYGENYVCTNVEILDNDEWKTIGNKYRYFETPINGFRILSFGFLFNFNRNNQNTKVTAIEEVLKTDWFKDIMDKFPEKDLDYVVIIGHIPITHQWKELQVLHKFLRSYYPNIVIQYFGGHSHIRDFVVYDDNSTSLESGRFCETVGWLSIDNKIEGVRKFSRKYIDFNMNSFKYHSKKFGDFQTKQGNEVKQMIEKARQDLNLNEYIGHVGNNYYMDYVPIDDKHSIFKLLSEKILPSLEYPKDSNEERMFIINTGSVRYDLYKGNYTVDTKYIISPFKNDWVKISLPKSLAIKVSAYLNKGGYLNLLPAHQWAQVMNPEKFITTSGHHPGFTTASKNQPYPIKRLTKGYVTHDDFGTDGDDTLHYPTINFPIPNVVDSKQFKHLEESTVDLVFYNFLKWNVIEALIDLDNKDYSQAVEFYSDVYLSEMITNYIKEFGV